VGSDEDGSSSIFPDGNPRGALAWFLLRQRERTMQGFVSNVSERCVRV
jgi:hypothetical protein